MELLFWRVSANLSISTGTVHNVLKQFEETRGVAAPGQKERPDIRRLTSTEELFIVGLVLESSALQLQEVCKAVQELSGVTISPSTVCRLLRKHGFTGKKWALLLSREAHNLEQTSWQKSFSTGENNLRKHDEVLEAMTNPIPLIQSAFDSITPIWPSSWITYWILILMQTLIWFNCGNINAFPSVYRHL